MTRIVISQWDQFFYVILIIRIEKQNMGFLSEKIVLEEKESGQKRQNPLYNMVFQS